MELDISIMGSMDNMSDITSSTVPDTIPEDLQNSKIFDCVTYTILFLIGAPANVRVLHNLVANKSFRKSRHHFILLNLAVADSFVSLIMIPAEIGWSLTNAWLAGNLCCKLFQFFRAFGPYSSSMVLICISIDR